MRVVPSVDKKYEKIYNVYISTALQLVTRCSNNVIFDTNNHCWDRCSTRCAPAPKIKEAKETMIETAQPLSRLERTTVGNLRNDKEIKKCTEEDETGTPVHEVVKNISQREM